MEAAVVAQVAAAVFATPPEVADIDLQNSLRAAFGGLRVVVCSDDDVPPNIPAALENARCRLYYLDASEHCVRLSREAEGASGLLVGRLGDLDDDAA